MVVGLSSMAVVFFQENADKAQDTHHGVIWLAVIGIALVMQALAVVGAAIAAFGLMKKLDAIGDKFEAKTDPIITKANALLDDLGPKIKTITTNAEDISYTVKVKIGELSKTVDDLNRTVQDINERSKVQISRVDGIVSDALATTYEVQQTVQESIKKPVRQIAGIIAGVRTGIETLIARSPFPFGKRDETGPYDL